MKVTKKCAFCGQSFETRSGMQRYCSEACQAESKRARAIQKNNLFKLAQPLMEIQHQEYLTFSKAATLMGCSRQYIYKLVAIGKFNFSDFSDTFLFLSRNLSFSSVFLYSPLFLSPRLTHLCQPQAVFPPSGGSDGKEWGVPPPLLRLLLGVGWGQSLASSGLG